MITARRRSCVCRRLLLAVACLMWASVQGVSAQEFKTLHPRVEQQPIFDWVDPAVIELDAPVPADGEGTPAHYLVVDDQSLIPPKGPLVEFRRLAYRINSRSALEDWSSVRIVFEPSYQRVVLHEFAVHRQGHWSDRVSRSHWSLSPHVRDQRTHIYDQRIAVRGFPDDVRVGDVVKLTYSIVGENPILGPRWTGGDVIGSSYPIANRRLRYRAHVNRPIRYRVHGADHAPSTLRRGEWIETRWDLTGLSASHQEDNATYDTITQPWVEFSEFKDWKQVVDWALPLYSAAIEVTPEVQRVADGIRQRCSSPEEMVVTARNWVQDEIRYLAIIPGNHSHAPRHVNDVLARRYGDCKEKAVLFVSLLRALGIDAWPALVETDWRAKISEWLPGPGAFDHVIVALGRGEKRLWIDPTLTDQGGGPAGLVPPPYRTGLVIAPFSRDLESIPTEESRAGLRRVIYRYHLEPGGTAARVEIESVYRGSSAERVRSSFASNSLDQIEESYLDFYQSPERVVTTKSSLEVEDDRAKNLIRTSETYFVKEKGDSGESTSFDLLPLLMEDDLHLPSDAKRDGPWALTFPLRRQEIVELHDESNLEYEEVSDSVVNPWFRFTAKSRKRNGHFEIHYELETLQDRVAAKDLSKYAEQLNEMWSHTGYRIYTGDQDFSELTESDLRVLLVLAVVVAAFMIFLIAIGLVVYWVYR